MNQRQVIVDTDKCIGCGLCRKVCVAHNIVIHDKKAQIVLNDCVMCGQCSAVCSKRAISLVGCGSGEMEKSGDARLDPDDILTQSVFAEAYAVLKRKKFLKR